MDIDISVLKFTRLSLLFVGVSYYRTPAIAVAQHVHGVIELGVVIEGGAQLPYR